LLQRLLSEHPAIASLPEPWVMLPLIYAQRASGLATEYSARFAHQALSQFLASLPDGYGTYTAAVRAAGMTLYRAALESSGKQLFLDKTPRYFLIIPELKEIFPQARFLFLVRNPLAVFTSIWEAHAGGDWTELGRRDRFLDLVMAPRAIHEAITGVGGGGSLIRYEDLVEDPESCLKDICTTLEVPFDPAVLRYGKVTDPGAYLGDAKSVHLHGTPVGDYVEAWRSRLDVRWKRGLAVTYLRELGPGIVDGLGYDYSALERDLVVLGTSRAGGRRWRLISTPGSERSWRDRVRLATARSVHERGWLRTILRVLYIAWWGRPRRRPPDPAVTD
jgi:hypothetical protein